jgi:hypothetical protein
MSVAFLGVGILEGELEAEIAKLEAMTAVGANPG